MRARSPATAPAVASVALSVNSWAASLACVAPSDERTAISLSRSAERASSMWPTLAQATTSRRPTAASSTISGVRTSRLTRSLSGIDRSSAPVLVVRIVAGQRRADRGELLLRSLVAHTIAEPSDDVHHGYRARRAIRVQRKRQPDLGAGRPLGTPWMPVMGIRKSAGSVPTIVCGRPSSCMVCPFSATAPKERRQNASLTITTAGPPGAYSSAANVRPCTGVT